MRLGACVPLPTVEFLPRFSEAVRNPNDPDPQRDHANEQFHAHVCEFVLDSGRHLFEVMTKHQAITFELPQGERQHALSHPVHAPADFCVAKPAIHTERMHNTERPTTSCMREHLAPHTVVVVTQTIADGLRIPKNLVSVHSVQLPVSSQVSPRIHLQEVLRHPTQPWHYQSINTCEPPELVCADDQCAGPQIDKAIQALKTRKGNQLKALRVLVHLVGDIHQPLHAAENGGDRGANYVIVKNRFCVDYKTKQTIPFDCWFAL